MKKTLRIGAAIGAFVLCTSTASAQSFSYGTCNVNDGGGGFKPVLILILDGQRQVFDRGFRGLDYRVMQSPWLSQLWIRRAFPDATDGLRGNAVNMCGATRDIDTKNTTEGTFTPPETEECEFSECEFYGEEFFREAE